MLDVITNELVNGDKVKLVNFGEFLIKNRAGKKGFNPYYRKSVDIPPCKEPSFVAGKVLKEIINKE